MNNEDKINDIEPHAEAGKLTTWEIDFVANLCAVVGAGNSLTENQQASLDAIHAKYCE